MMNSNEWIDAWLKDELDVQACVRFEALRASDSGFDAEVQAALRLHQSLKRSFAAGSGKERAVGAVLQAIEESNPSTSPTLVAACLAAAAGFMFLIAHFGRAPKLEPLDAMPREVGLLTAGLGLPGFDGAKQLAGGRLVPDMDAMLCAAKQFTDQKEVQQCSALDSREGRASMERAVGLASSALSVLVGPITASEWPGSIFFASQSSEGMSLLIAGQDGLNTCCLDVRAPDDSDLRVHTWRVGETLWYEISPYDEPRLLTLVEN